MGKMKFGRGGSPLQPEPKIVERIVEKIIEVEKPVEKIVHVPGKVIENTPIPAKYNNAEVEKLWMEVRKSKVETNESLMQMKDKIRRAMGIKDEMNVKFAEIVDFQEGCVSDFQKISDAYIEMAKSKQQIQRELKKQKTITWCLVALSAIIGCIF